MCFCSNPSIKHRYRYQRLSPAPLEYRMAALKLSFCKQKSWSAGWQRSAFQLSFAVRVRFRAECTKIARFSAVAAAIFTAPPQNRAIFKAPRCAISFAKKIASERRFSLRLKGTNLIPTAEFPAIPESAAKIASERRCAILVHSGTFAYGLKAETYQS